MRTALAMAAICALLACSGGGGGKGADGTADTGAGDTGAGDVSAETAGDTGEPDGAVGDLAADQEVRVDEVCVATCAEGQECGDDGSGCSCGTCETGWECNQAGKCVMIGPPSCMGNCGTFGPDHDGDGEPDCSCFNTCAEAGDCCEDICTACPDSPGCCEPECGDKECGSDGCGGDCGQCTGGKACDETGKCVEAPCYTWQDMEDKMDCEGVCKFIVECGHTCDNCQIDCEMIAGNGSGFMPCFTDGDRQCWHDLIAQGDCGGVGGCYALCNEDY
jgi:hypothetical protein